MTLLNRIFTYMFILEAFHNENCWSCQLNIQHRQKIHVYNPGKKEKNKYNKQKKNYV